MNLRIRCQIIKSVFHGKRKFIKDFQIKCKEIRIEILDLFEKGERGHLPSAYSLVEILVTLYFYHSKITPRNYHQSDKILLSKGHGCMALYSILSDLGFIDKKEYLLFCKVGGILGGHPTRNPSIGVEISSGSLGHGASIGLGKALALKLKNILDKNIYVVLGDGECNEGSVWEAA
ncbi:MAG: hypothetical protein HN576_09940, partial [Bacteriovoracaceae bacterium]|nr:hypothetical protein [Bacteriovoracaceae bacterium]